MLDVIAVQGEELGEPKTAFPREDTTFQRLRPGYVAGDLGFDPLGLKPTNDKDLKNIATKELNNGRLAMIGIAGMVAQELVSGMKI